MIDINIQKFFLSAFFTVIPMEVHAYICDNNVDMVAQASTNYTRVADLKVKWGEDGVSQCSVSYMLAPGIEDDTKQTAIQRFSNECR